MKTAIMDTLGYSAMWILLFLMSSAFFAQEGKDDYLKERKMMEMYLGYKAEAFPNIPDISVYDYLALDSLTKVVIVDTREKKERRVSMIPSAISREDFQKNIERYREHLVVVYCTIGYRSGVYAQQLLKKGLNVKNLIGSVLAWAHADQPFRNAEGETLRVHVYGKTWDLLPEKYQAVW